VAIFTSRKIKRKRNMDLMMDFTEEYESPSIEVISLELEGNVAGLPASGLIDPQ
jgi:hypothetical protein